MKRRFIATVSLLVVLLAMPCSLGALSAHLQLEGANQGPIEGDAPEAGFEDMIEVFDFHHLIVVPTELTTGLPSGTIQHHQIIFTTRIGRSTPQLMQAMGTGETMSIAIFRFRRPDPKAGGAPHNYYTVELLNSRIFAVEPITADTLDPANAGRPDMARVRMGYQEIIFRDEIHSTEFQLAVAGKGG